jgi:alpha/beta superfamily hydrolase
MTLHTERRLVDGPVGPIEIALDRPAGTARGVAFIGHPHPLYGGTLDNKVAATLARSFAALGCVAVRPNFRGVGRSAGTHDHGDGETDDFLHLIDSAPQWLGAPAQAAAAPFALAGFSFGTFVASRAAARLAEQGRAPRHLVLVGSAAGKWPMPAIPADTLLVHGEYDETIPLPAVFEWARPLEVPVVVLPGADHFFHRRLSILKRLVMQYVAVRELTPEDTRIDAADQSR